MKPCLLFPVFVAVVAGAAAQSPSNHPSPAKIQYSRLPMVFEAAGGRGSWTARGAGYSVRVEAGGAVIQAGGSGKTKMAVEMKLAGARAGATPEPVDLLPGKSNYLLGSDPKKWRTGVEQYRGVRYRSIYPGVDILYYGNQNHLEYDLEAAPGSNLSKIELQVSGADRILAGEDGGLRLATAAGELLLHRPVVYQNVGGARKQLAAAYRIAGRNRVRFDVGAHDPKLPLVIDPVISFAALLGGGSDGQYGFRNIALDSANNIYVTGGTWSPDLPTVNPVQSASAGVREVMVAKLSADGKTLLYSTYVGGSRSDLPYAIAADASGAVAVVGVTESTAFPTVNAAQPAARAGQEGFVFKVAPSGNALVFSTFLGGDSDDYPVAVAIDSASGRVFVTGQTASANFPTTPGAFQTALKGMDGFVTAFTASGAFWYSTFLGGTSGDYPYDVAVDSAGAAYVAGGTNSSDFPVTPGVPHGTKKGGGLAGFVSKLRPDGSGLVFSTFLGGTLGPTYPYAIAVDAAGNVTVVGETYASDFPATSGAFSGASDAFVTRLSSNGSAILFSRLLGGTGTDRIRCIGLDAAGNIAFAGETLSGNFPVVNAMQGAKVGGAFGLYTSTNGGATWAGSWEQSRISYLSAAPGNPSVVYMVRNGSLYQSTDSGGTFSYRGWYPGGGPDLVVHPTDPSVLYSATWGGGIWVSTNGGQTWTEKTGAFSGPASAVAFAPSDPSTMYAGLEVSPGLYKSTDAGSTWAPVAAYAGEVSKIAVDPGNPLKVYVAGFSQISVSSDGGATWSAPASLGDGSVAGLKAAAPSIVYVALGDTVYRSADGGATWVAGPAGATINAFDFDTANPAVLYAATSFGVLKSSDSGATWNPVAATSPLGKDSANTILALPGKVLAGAEVRSDLFLATLNPSGTALTMSTYLGTAESDSISGMAVSPDGSFYLTMPTPFLVTPGAYASPARGDISVMKIGAGDGGCATTLDRTSKSISKNPRLERLIVSSGSGCAWTASTAASWISFPAGPSGTGFGILDYRVAANPGPSARTGTIDVNGQTLTVTQQATGGWCAIYPFSPVTLGSGATTWGALVWPGSSGSSGCVWTVSTSDPWITLGTSGGTGIRSVNVSVTAQTTAAARVGTVVFTSAAGDTTLTVYQSGQGCSTQLTTSSASVLAGGGSVTVPFVSTPANCAAWAASGTSWATVSGPAAGAGSANVTFQVQANPWDSPRSGMLQVGDRLFSVNQAAGSQCAALPISLSTPVNGSLASSDCDSSFLTAKAYAKHYKFQATAGQQIAIEATSPTLYPHLSLVGPDGVELQSGSFWNISTGARIPYSGFYTLPAAGTYIIEATSFESVTGPFQVQLLPACSLTLPAQGAVFAPGGGSGSLTPTGVSAGCTVTSYSPDWVSLTSGLPSIGYSVSAATSASPRTTMLSVGGQPFFITQGGTTTFSFTPTSAQSPVQGGPGTFGIAQNGPTDGFYAVALQPWLHVGTVSTRGFYVPGTTSVSYSVDPNTGAARAGQIAIGAQVFTVNQDGAPVPTGLRFVPVTPCRVADTRVGTGSFGVPRMSGGETRSIPIPSGACGIPSNAAAYSLNTTVVPAGPLGYLTLWPAGQIRPAVSTLNSLEGRIKANAAIVPAGTSGAVSVFVSASTDVILDINGYFVPATDAANLAFYPVTPCRVADTRVGTGPFGGPILTPAAARTFAVPQSACSIPANAAAYSLNFTVVPQGPLGYLSTWPAGQPQPVVSTLNSPSGAIVANAAIVPAGTNGGITVYASAISDVIIDINGYFAPPGGAGALSLYPVFPCRVADTRMATGPLGVPMMVGSQSRDFPLANGPCGIPGTAQAYSLNSTVVPQSILGYLTLWPAGGLQPMVSTLNALDGNITANAAIIPAGTAGAISAYVSAATDLILDINGYFAP